MKFKNLLMVSLVLVVLALATSTTFLILNITNKAEAYDNAQAIADSYNPQINPSDFTTKIDNKYMTFNPGTTLIYEGETEEGTERTEVYVTDTIKNVMGVNVLEVRDRVWLEGNLIEDTKDWYAQDKYGNVWYFGEDSKDLIDGKVVSTKGSWVSGYYEAKPGIVMKANPQIGETYRQEYYPGVAEDMGEVVALGVKIKVKYGTFTNCLQTKDWNPLEPGDEEYKYYCPEVGGVVHEVSIEDGQGMQLIDIKKADTKKVIEEAPVGQLKTEITEEEAITIAKSRVNGEVTDVAIEKKFGKAAYVVEINDNGQEIDVIIDIETGEVLGIEN